MLRIILLIGYLAACAYISHRVYIDSEIEDRSDKKYIIGVIVGTMVWPVIFLVTVVCSAVDAYYDEE